MRSMFTLAIAIAAMVGTCGFAPADDPEKVGTLLPLPIGNGNKVVDVEAKVGDLLQFELGYAVVPEQMVSELKMEFSGKGLTHVATVLVPKKAEPGKVVVGVMTIAGFVRADKAGEVTVKIVPRLANGKAGPKAEFKVTVK